MLNGKITEKINWIINHEKKLLATKISKTRKCGT